MPSLRILVVNDDGIDAPGIRPLAVAAVAAGHEVVIAAPARQWSGASAAILVDDDADQVAVDRRQVPGVPEAFAVHAAPAMCVLLALRGSFGPRPDVVLSGINYGANTGRVLLHSGTAGAALTAGVGGLRALAVSLDVDQPSDALHWEDAAAAAVTLLPLLQAQPAATVLNLNAPNRPGAFEFREAPLATGGVVRTSSADGGDEEELRAALGRAGAADAGSDLDLLAQGYATVTAITPPGAVALQGALP
ncbi:5'/3'-nucleotidase SurE [Amnibacterium endophyticum]|uniref:5'-nucleotidase n=1 Tax=Amnibacterium endophyticum TaxID=2109337 RepID=A0ABW4LHD7_9MICO